MHRVQEVPPRALVELLLAQELDEAAECEERRTQLVGSVRDELAASVVELGETRAHPLEGGGQLAHLVRALVLNGLIESAPGDALRGPLQPPDPPRERPRGQIPAGQCGEQREQAREHEAALDERNRPELVAQGGRDDEQHVRPERMRDLCELHASLGHRPALRRVRRGGPAGQRAGPEPRSGGLGVGDVAQVHAAGTPLHVVEDQASVDEPRLIIQVNLPGRPVLGQTADDPARLLVQLRDLRVDEPALERGDDDEVDNAEGAENDEEKGQRKARADAPQRVHRSLKR